jgi:hypothetical protein
MKKSEVILRLTSILEKHRKTKMPSDHLARWILERLDLMGMLPPYSETKAKTPKPVGHEWDDE